MAPPPVPGFVGSSFGPLAAEAARRCLDRRPGPVAELPVTAVLLVAPLGDLGSAVRVAEAVDGGARLGPLLFFQAVPHAVAGHVAARRGLTGPVVCVAETAGALEVAGLLLADGDADAVLLLRVDQATAPEAPDHAAAVLLTPPPPGGQPESEQPAHEHPAHGHPEHEQPEHEQPAHEHLSNARPSNEPPAGGHPPAGRSSNGAPDRIAPRLEGVGA
ncbi:hypothetical protein ACIQBJ_16015 [Kitasatospora sp. NPDC088391]|uniref:hypothetical protein n=1 Tax=Kitasatospora sp. NPDC088391 TaxID=3364074 RepID=UPI00382D7E82